MECCTIFFLQRSKMKNRIIGGHVPSAKIVGERRYSIISDYLGTPTRFVRVEMSANIIHGHPIIEAEYKKLTKVY